MGLFLWSEMESLCLEVEGVSLGFEDVNGGGGVWFVLSNNHFQFLNICTKRARSLGLSGLSNYVDLMAALIVKSK